MGRLKRAAASFRVQAAALALVMTVFLGAGFLAAYSVEQSIQDMIRGTTNARLQAVAAQDVLSALQDAEAGQRGYLLTGRATYLEPVHAAAARIETLLANLAARTSGLPARAALAGNLAAAARHKMQELQRTVAEAERGNRASMVAELAADDGKARMDEARAAATRVIEAAEQERAARAGQLQRSQALVTDLLLCSLVGGVMLLGAAAIVLLWNLSRLRIARRAEQLQAARFEAAIEHVPDGVGVFDAEGHLTLLNARFAATLGLPRGQGAPGTALPAIAAAAALDPPLLDGPRPATPLASEARQGPRTLEIWRSPMPDGGQILAVADLSRRVAAEEVARQAQKMDVLGQMTGGVAHDFNNLLQVVSANLELVRARLERGEAGPHLLSRLDAASAGVARGARLTRHLLAFARRQPLAPRPLDAAYLLRNMEEVLRRTLGESVRLELVIEPGLWAMRADPTQFENALLNLALNARDAMAGTDGAFAGTLTIEAANATLGPTAAPTFGEVAPTFGEVAPGEYVAFAVRDTGPGMDPAQAARALEPFYTTKPEGRGTGLGLPMVLGFAKQSGGHFQLDSAPGQGTTARIYIPRTTAAALRTEKAPQSAPRGNGELVLLVEDDPAVRAAAREAITALGYRTIEADSAQAGIELLEAGAKPNLLFTDVVMPGPVTARQLAERATRLLPGIAVLYTSGYTQDAIGRNGQLDPGTILIGKPWRSDELARALRSVLTGNKPRRRRVLLVEDEEDIRAITADALSEQGFEVIEAGSVQSALESLQPPPDLLMTDLGLPGGDGMALVAEVRRRVPGLPVIVASGQPDPGQGALGAERTVWLTKPFDLAALDRAVAQALAEALV